MKLNLNFVAFLTLIALAGVGCSDNTVEPIATPDDTNNTSNANAIFEFSMDGDKISAKTILADYGEKIYITGLNAEGNLVVDFALPVKQDQLVSKKTFSYTDQVDVGKAIFYIGSDQWNIEGGELNVTKHSGNRISGNFSGPTYLLDYSTGAPVAIDSSYINDGVFSNIYVKP